MIERSYASSRNYCRHTDDTKLWRRISTYVDSLVLQEDLDSLQQRCEHWAFFSNHVLDEWGPWKKRIGVGAIRKGPRSDHIRSPIFQSLYKICNNNKESNCYGLKDFQESGYCRLQTALHNLLRPHTEFCIQAWSPHLVRHCDPGKCLESCSESSTDAAEIQLSCQDCTNDRHTSLEDRRVRGMNEVCKLLTGKEKINYMQLFNFTKAPYGLKGHEKKLAKDRSTLDTRKFVFSQRVINGWNGLAVNTFKNACDHSYCEYYEQQRVISCRVHQPTKLKQR